MSDHANDAGHEAVDISNPSQNKTFASVLHGYMSRRTLLKGAVAGLVLGYASPLLRPSAAVETSGFTPLTHSTEDKLLVPDGYGYNVVIRWGDPVLPDTPGFDPIELVEDGGEHGATTFHWDLFIACGDPNNPGDNAFYQGHKDKSWMSCPDNIAFDDAGRLWVATDGQTASIKKNDAVYVVEVEGHLRGLTKMFLSGLPGGEICGPAFTSDNRTFFVAIQHPGEGKGSTFANPLSRFPDYTPGMPPRPSVVAIYRLDGGQVGS
jgi:secreted PhoX family phosphatase